MNNENIKTYIIIFLGTVFAFIIVFFNFFYNFPNNYKNLSEVSFEFSVVSETVIPEEYIKYNRLNLNKASKEHLMKFVPDLDEALAENIIAYRERVNGFSYITELKKVPGISEEKFKQIYDCFYLE